MINVAASINNLGKPLQIINRNVLGTVGSLNAAG